MGSAYKPAQNKSQAFLIQQLKASINPCLKQLPKPHLYNQELRTESSPVFLQKKKHTFVEGSFPQPELVNMANTYDQVTRILGRTLKGINMPTFCWFIAWNGEDGQLYMQTRRFRVHLQ